MHAKFGEQAPFPPGMYWRFVRVRLAQEFGWNLDYIDSLKQQELGDVFAVLGAQNKLKEEAAEKSKRRRR